MPSEPSNIVIIGASVAGHNLANALYPTLPSTHRILLIDALDYSFFPIACLRAAVVPGWEDKVTVPLTTKTVFPSGTAHEVIAPNKVIELRENSVVLEKPFEGSTEVTFFRCVIATGASQPSPMRPPPGATNQKQFVDNLRRIQSDVSRAKKVVIIGGGTVGIEFAGEVRDAHPDTEITIVHSKPYLLSPIPSARPESSSNLTWSSPPTNPRLSKSLEQVLITLNVNLVLDDSVSIPVGDNPSLEGEWNGSFGLQSEVKKLKLKSGKEVLGDYIFVSVGNNPNTGLVASVDPAAITSGLIAVDVYLKIASDNPASFLTKSSNYYAVGDASAVPGLKTAWLANISATHVAKNIINEVKGKGPLKYSPGSFSGLFVPVGPTHGAGSITFPFLGTWIVGGSVVGAAKGKDLLIGRVWQPLWQGSEKVDSKI
ncbi:hypothetical protein I308_102139 [Cryptococcus tetragattii IND107]|uniref:FAD/NAD(P)-binding domain-containing protein n=1 Tax=Cryptococcus tetragattii IND107 TaxID=1296105 RepID=A0ABR3BWJ2_9TREE|nr:hypothetical protein I308_02262 [Cryptococcus tetragattii IND107]